MNNNQAQFVKAHSGDVIHQSVAIYYHNNGIEPKDVVDILKASNYIVSVKGTMYKLQASCVASIMTGIAICNPAKNKKLKPINNGTGSNVPEIPVEE